MIVFGEEVLSGPLSVMTMLKYPAEITSQPRTIPGPRIKRGTNREQLKDYIPLITQASTGSRQHQFCPLKEATDHV